MRIKTRRQTTYTTTYSLTFEYIGSNGSGCAFDCDKDGKVDVAKLHPCGQETYREAMSGEVTRRENVQYKVGADGEYEPIEGTGAMITRKVSKGHIQEYEHRQVTPAVGECNHCGRDVHLHGFTNTCECGADYNMSGQELAPREQWGEETGESVSDILSADADGYDNETPWGESHSAF
jgi:hypothetical protein